MGESHDGTKGCKITSQTSNFFVSNEFGNQMESAAFGKNLAALGKPKNRLKLNPLSLQRPVDAGDNRLERGNDNVLVDADAKQR